MNSDDLTSARWFKSSHSDAQNNCVEVAFMGHVVAMRDSKDPSGPALTFMPGQFAAFVRSLRDGGYNGL